MKKTETETLYSVLVEHDGDVWEYEGYVGRSLGQATRYARDIARDEVEPLSVVTLYAPEGKAVVRYDVDEHGLNTRVILTGEKSLTEAIKKERENYPERYPRKGGFDPNHRTVVRTLTEDELHEEFELVG